MLEDRLDEVAVPHGQARLRRGTSAVGAAAREGSAAGPLEQGASLARTHLDRGPHGRGRPMTSATGITSSSPRRMVTALFDSRSDAENAIGRLVNAGVPQDRIGLMPGDESDASDDAGASSRPEPRGFWGSLGDWLLPDEDRHVYAEGLSRGGYLISVTTGDEHYARVMAILDSEDAIDIDERTESWRSEGWAGWRLARQRGWAPPPPSHRLSPASARRTAMPTRSPAPVKRAWPVPKPVCRSAASTSFQSWKRGCGSASVMSATGTFAFAPMWWKPRSRSR